MIYDFPPPLGSTLFPYTTLFRSRLGASPSELGTARPLSLRRWPASGHTSRPRPAAAPIVQAPPPLPELAEDLEPSRSEEHTSELQSRRDIVCRLLLEKKKSRQAC